MSTFLIDVPMPSMGATVSELTILAVHVSPGTKVAKGQKLAELESDKSAFEFESPVEGTIVEVHGAKGDVKASGQQFFRMETSDSSVKHMEVAGVKPAAAPAVAAAAKPSAASTLVWTPRALKLAQEAGLTPSTITDIAATGPGGRVSGDDVANYLASRK